MLHPQYWRDLKSEFENLPEACDRLHAEWNPKGWAFTDGGGCIELSDQWSIGSKPKQDRLISRLAERGAFGLGFLSKMDAAPYWFERLRREGLYCEPLQLRISNSPETTHVIEGTVITNVRLASIELCEELVTDSLREELAGGASNELHMLPADANDVSADLEARAAIDAIDAEFRTHTATGVKHHHTMIRAVLQTFDVLVENTIRKSFDQTNQSARLRLHTKLPDIVLDEAIEHGWVRGRGKSVVSRNHQRIKLLLSRRAKYAEALIWPEDSPSSRSSRSMKWRGFTRLAARLWYVKRTFVGGMQKGERLIERDSEKCEIGEPTRLTRERDLRNYIELCLTEQRLAVTAEDVRRVAGYSGFTSLYKWLKDGTGDKRFRKVFAKPTAQFVLEARQLRPSKKI